MFGVVQANPARDFRLAVEQSPQRGQVRLVLRGSTTETEIPAHAAV